MAKEKSVNPAQAAHKAEKAKALKKGKAQVQAQRQERLAKRNPERLQREIEDLKARGESGDLRPHDRQRLGQLEKEAAAVKKAREALGDKAPRFGSGEERRDGNDQRGGRGGARGGARGGGVLGKRRRDGERSGRESSSDTDEDARHIPMPRDTPPPLPRRHVSRPDNNANDTPLGDPRLPHVLPPKPVAKIVYESAPQLRDLRKEATSKFVPTAVQSKLKLAKGGVQGRLLEPEELEKLEKEGYAAAGKAAEAGAQEAEHRLANRAVGKADMDLDAIEAEFERELRDIEMEDARTVDRDAEGAAEAAVQEAEHLMIAAEAEGKIRDSKSEGHVAERQLRHVEIEEVEDEDL
ncbi:uncharacterized protein BDZ99DRAFT_498263 [Mytilinidion resinicola]|uniref:Wbp11/ELF5/Saf1 N-terminal domain-containing protein n=1 Tax=Mytilinidion resinicola TaxID=574789 RepID=A0A6A6YMT3_9PEZI|nr:uncharacterized protein BDZ99DRAFT_498263 [Mytilinidion resinicola]KAF2810051.1 hypothetical protein BDZ99DRAFT_498263 [Mytilinidion resinicola]